METLEGGKYTTLQGLSGLGMRIRDCLVALVRTNTTKIQRCPLGFVCEVYLSVLAHAIEHTGDATGIVIEVVALF